MKHLLFAFIAARCTALSIPATKPDAAVTVPPNFVGFAIESAFVNNNDNDFVGNLIDSIAARMSRPPVIRVGGTGGDKFKFDPEQKKDKVCEQGPCNSSNANFTLGPSFFKSYQRFKSAEVTIQAPLDNPINITNTVSFVWHAWNNLDQGKRVAAIAIGNEVEFIYDTAGSYTKAALELQANIIKNLNLSGDAAKIFETGNTASGSVRNNRHYQVEDILKAGIDGNDLISTTAEHWYQILPQDGDSFTDATMQAITERFKRHAPGLRESHKRGIPFAINECAAVLGGGPISFSGGFGYALWSVDFNLAAMARGVTRVNNMVGQPSAKRVFWNPDSTGGEKSPGPQVRAPFPAAMFVADFISNGSSSAVAEIETDSDLTSAYAMYDAKAGKLRRVALVNLRLYNGTRTELRKAETFTLPLPDAVEKIRVRRLHADKGVAAMGFDFGGPKDNVSWAGEQWSHSIDTGNGHFLNGKVDETLAQVDNGRVSVDVPDSEAVMLLIE
ncbi:hypothetical protein FDECE_2310 [Fusarium decemcellulare]|nr:hypothetical protein FDECE_2310 [Fusarium decemcellulare]